MRALLVQSAVVYLDADCRFPHPDKVPPLQSGSESPLQHDDESEHFAVEQGLQLLTLSLPQEHLKGGTTVESHTLNGDRGCNIYTFFKKKKEKRNPLTSYSQARNAEIPDWIHGHKNVRYDPLII